MKVPFYRADISQKDQENVIKVLKGELKYAKDVLEREFEKYIGCSHALATSDGTAALHLAMLAISLKRGDKVLCSVNAFPSIPEVVRHFDAEPVFIDVDEGTFNIDLNKLEAYLEEHQAKKLKAVIVSHIAGQSVDLDRLYRIGKLYNVRIIEDATDALGGTYNGEKFGATGADITCFSFTSHLKRNLCHGGMLVSDDDEIIERARLLRNHAMVWEEESLDYIYDVVDVGSKYTLSEMDATLLTAQLAKTDANNRRQKEIAAHYLEALKGLAHIKVPVIENDHIFSMFIIKIDKNRDSFSKELQKKQVSTGLHYIPLHLMSYYKQKYELRINEFPIALKNYQQILSIPIFPSMSDAEVEYVVKSIKEVSKSWI